MPSGYAGEVCHGSGQGRGTDTIHIPEQAQVERDQSQDGAEDRGSVEDEAGWIQAVGGEHLHEAGSMMDTNTKLWVAALIILTVILTVNLGGLWIITHQGATQ